MSSATATNARLSAAFSADINQSLSAEKKKEMLQQMIRIRAFEYKSLKYYNQGKIAGFLHLYIGQENIAVACANLMGENDHMITAYRDHGHALAVGMGMDECMAELFGKATGCSKGKGGSMHYFAPDKNYWGGHGIVGGQTPLGLGIAFAMKYKGLTGSCMTFLGDGAVNQGAFHESLNLAALWNIPVIYIIENNRYSMGTCQARSSAYRSCLAERADGYGIDWAHVEDGYDLYTVRKAVGEAIKRAHEKSRPTVLEINTYRYYGHSVADAKHKTGYRQESEIIEYQKNFDCITFFKDHLLAEGVITELEITAMETAADAEAEAAGQFASESAYPEPASIFEDVYYEVDHQTEAGRTGQHFFNSL